MGIITLTTDFGLKDPYIGAIKGKILSISPQINIIDISHLISPFNVLEAAYILKNAYDSFPKGSVHLVGVSSVGEEDGFHIAIKCNGHYFVGPNNGIFSILFDKEIDSIYKLTVTNDSDYLTFPEKNIFAKVACHLAEGGSLDVIGKKIDSIETIKEFEPVIKNDIIEGQIIYVDNYDNTIININQTLFNTIGKGRPFELQCKKGDYQFNHISKDYNEVSTGSALVLFGDNNLLQISIKNATNQMGGGANKLLGLTVGDKVVVEFKNQLF